MMRKARARTAAWVGIAALLAGCGGGGGGAGTTASAGAVGAGSMTPTPTPTTAGAPCSLRARQDWAAAQLNEWYLFPETLPASLDPGSYASVGDYVDALTATARAQRRDRYFTYVTSIAEENAYYASGETAGFGMRLQFDANYRLLVSEAFEGSPAFAAGVDRGAEITAIGASIGTLRSVSSLVAANGANGVVDALGPDTAGTARAFRVVQNGVTRDLTLTKTDFELTPVSSRYGARILQDGERRIGYLNLRTFISTADPALRSAFATFRASGITQFVVDLRYNGGGLVSTALLITRLLGGARSTGDVLRYTTFRGSKAAENSVEYFAPEPESVAATRIAFIGTGSTASASEQVMNAFTPYLGNASALIGSNTYGKPVGQIARDNTACDERLRVVAFAGQNAARQGDYYDGLANKMGATCRANDDLAYPLGDAREASVATALTFLRGGICTPIAGATGTVGTLAAPTQPLRPDRPTAAQREAPGLF